MHLAIPRMAILECAPPLRSVCSRRTLDSFILRAYTYHIPTSSSARLFLFFPFLWPSDVWWLSIWWFVCAHGAAQQAAAYTSAKTPTILPVLHFRNVSFRRASFLLKLRASRMRECVARERACSENKRKRKRWWERQSTSYIEVRWPVHKAFFYHLLIFSCHQCCELFFQKRTKHIICRREKRSVNNGCVVACILMMNLVMDTINRSFPLTDSLSKKSVTCEVTCIPTLHLLNDWSLSYYRVTFSDCFFHKKRNLCSFSWVLFFSCHFVP